MQLTSITSLFAVGVVASAAQPARVPLIQRSATSKGPAEVAKQSLRAVLKRAGGSGIAAENLDAGFWYGTFTAGAASNLSLLIDTGSSDAAVNPGLYKPTPASKDLNETGELRYSTTEENGCGQADIFYTQFSDTFSLASLTSTNQTFASVRSTPPPNNGTITVFPHDGLVGFAGADGAQLDATPFFENLCAQGVVADCRFGLAFGTDGTGEQILGALDSGLFEGSNLTTVKAQDQWVVTADVYVGGEAGKRVASRQDVVLDSGTANVIGPPAVVQSLFDAAGIQGVNISLPGCTEVLTGYYPCASPPTVGFSFPTGSRTVFNIAPSAFEEADDGSGNCTATVAGINFGANVWIVGQSFFQGKYVDHNVDALEVGFAELKG